MKFKNISSTSVKLLKKHRNLGNDATSILAYPEVYAEHVRVAMGAASNLPLSPYSARELVREAKAAAKAAQAGAASAQADPASSEG